jgi:GNAT superfamily N-acetyltransferase
LSRVSGSEFRDRRLPVVTLGGGKHVENGQHHSICFGAYTAGRQIGFARVISDRAVFGYLADVFVLPEFRGHGVAKAMVSAVFDHPELQALLVFLLRTQNAHELYRPFGFTELPRSEEMRGRDRG